MKRLSIALSAILLSAFAGNALADTAEIAFFRGVMTPLGFTPPTNIFAGAPGTLICHIVRDSSGKVNSGSVTFVVGYGFPGPVTFTALDIHKGAAGTNGESVINAPLGPAPVPSDPSGYGLLQTEAEIPSTDTAGVAALAGMLATPDQYYIDLHTTSFPDGAIRAQLNRATFIVPMTLMTSAKAVPAVNGGTATAPAQLIVLTGRDRAGAITSAQLIFDVNLNFGKKTTVTAVHIHRGAEGVAGPLTIDSGLGQGFFAPVTTNDSGVGNLRQFAEVDMTNPDAVATIQGLINNPRSYYMDIHTTESGANPAARDQINGTDFDKFFMTLVPPGQSGSTTPPYSPSAFLVHNLRDEDGTVLVSSVMWISNFRFPGKALFTGFDLYEGAEGETGRKLTGSGLSVAQPFPTETGFGNIFFFTTISDRDGLSGLNGIMKNPDHYYLALTTGSDSTVAARAQVVATNTALPSVTAVGNSANGGPAAPGAVISIYGTNLAKFTSDPYDARAGQAPGLTAWFGKNLPTSTDGTSVTIGGVKAPLIYVSPTQINAQVPFEVIGRGPRAVVVTNSNGAGAPATLGVGDYAPAIFATASGAAIVKAKDGSLVSASNPASAGDSLIVYATGLGPTAPAFTSGEILTSDVSWFGTIPVTAKIGSADAVVQTVTGVPAFAGLYAVTLTVPSGVPAGTAKLQLQMPVPPLSNLGFVPNYSTSAQVDLAIQ